MASTMMHFDNDNLCRFMTKEEIKAKAPYIFATAPTNPNVSEKYTFANTETIIDDLAKLGWGVVDCRQQRANNRSNIRSFHMVCFQNKDVFISKENADGTESIDCFPRIILTTSHDGFKSFKFMIGLFRLVCSNGLIVATNTFANIAIRHMNYTFDELREVVAKAVDAVSDNVAVMNDMRGTILTDEQKNALALSALKIRKGREDDDKFKVPDTEIADVLTPLRKEDEGNDLWSVFNVLQEKVIKGEFHTTSDKNGRQRKARAIKGVAKDIEINQKLFLEATKYRMAA